MIEYVEIRKKSSREIIGIIDAAQSIIWHSVYFGVGDFEIYATATEKHVELLQEGNYVTRNDDIEVGIIESVKSETSINGTMLVASGRFAKSILDRRHIYKLSGKTNTPTILRGKVEVAVRQLVYDNEINCSFDTRRNINFLELGALSNIPAVIVDAYGQATQKQVSYENLLTYTDELLQEYNLGAIITLDDSTYKLAYSVYQGSNRSIDNTDGNEPVIFSQEYDNLTSSEYSLNTQPKKTAALIGGAGEDLERFYSLIPGTETGFERRETWIDAKDLNKTYKEEGSTQEREYTDTEYKAMLDAKGKQELIAAKTEEIFSADININAGQWHLNEDYWLGDVVTFQDNKINKYKNVRITELTEVQDENGYTIKPEFGDA